MSDCSLTGHRSSESQLSGIRSEGQGFGWGRGGPGWGVGGGGALEERLHLLPVGPEVHDVGHARREVCGHRTQGMAATGRWDGSLGWRPLAVGMAAAGRWDGGRWPLGWIVRMAAACCGRPTVGGSVSEGRRGGVGVGVWRQRVKTQG